MTVRGEITEKLLAALGTVPGLRPATPTAESTAARIPWDWDGIAIDLDDDVVRIRLVATRLPLPPLLRSAADVLRPVLVGTQWEAATLRLVVTDLDRDAV
ncbi:hypothetical protein SAMN05216266_101331 [Amycolatopsis marina]|uniref:Asp23 family, cell envelope-related function n=1 Tax=Amycolatopsis marina TaxID=490629 RepID=A0A1I0VNG1_9PSEU|nr:hypothetical protein [Amycolatopsis marina]SFA77126.1 hypothetical protein SAMN05216266_101331 [Amycolatopsis marina]